MPKNRIKTDAGKLAEALRGKDIGRRGLCGALSGFAELAIVVFIIGVISGLVVLPNLKIIIRWFKDVKKEFKNK